MRYEEGMVISGKHRVTQSTEEERRGSTSITASSAANMITVSCIKCGLDCLIEKNATKKILCPKCKKIK